MLKTGSRNSLICTLATFATFVGCTTNLARVSKPAPSAMSYADFVAAEAAPSAQASPSPSDPSANQDVDCDDNCTRLRQEFRYVVYVGKQIYCYWDEKKADTHTDYDALAKKLENSITSDTSTSDYYNTLRLWAASLHDGHVNVLNTSNSTDLATYSASVRLETLSPATDHEKLVVAASAVNGISVGDIVTAVNGQPAEKALDDSESTASGSTKRMRRWVGGRRLVDALGEENGAIPLVLTYVHKGVTQTMSLDRTATLTPQSNSDSDNTPPETTGIENLIVKVLPGGIGYLRINAFEGSQSYFLIDQAMSRLADTKGLIIDVRANGGGDQSGNAILSWLAPKDITRYEAEVKISDFTLNARPQYFAYGWDPRDAFTSMHPYLVSANQNSNKTYSGKPVVTLTSPNCFSACDTFVSALQVNQLSKIIGEATGGGTGTPLVFDLPVSGFQFRYPVEHGYTADGSILEGVGTQPDVLIEPTAEDRAKNQDPELLKAAKILTEMMPLPTDPTDAESTLGAMDPLWKQSLTTAPTDEDNLKLKALWNVDERESAH